MSLKKLLHSTLICDGAYVSFRLFDFASIVRNASIPPKLILPSASHVINMKLKKAFSVLAMATC